MDQTILKSPNDRNLYKALTLENSLRVLLIQTMPLKSTNLEVSQVYEQSGTDSDMGDESDVEGMTDDCDDESDQEASHRMKKHSSGDGTKMAAVALCIGVGSFHDPPELPGLTHFLEHMIFMGSEKYPEENYYDSFVSKHGGSDNAFTVCERTIFHMDITPKYLREALDIFANCFVSPLLKPDSMDREIEAVDSEFELSVASDNERSEFILKTLAKPGHPMSQFQFGNKISLKDEPEKLNIDVNAALRKFQQQYYSANRMTLAIQSIETLETLEEWVMELFSALPNNGLPITTFENLTGPFETESFHQLCKVVPVQTMDRLYITWALPPLMKHYKSKPLCYLAFLLGHEGKGSILAYLKKRCWATSVIAGNEEEAGFEMNTTGSLFTVLVILTEEGMRHQCEVITTVFQYMKMIQKHGPEERYFKELEIVNRTAFQFQEQEDPGENVAKLVEDMQLYPKEHYLCGGKLYFEYDPKVISDCIELMMPYKANIKILSSCYTENDCTEVEKWTGCKYSSCDIPSEWLSSWKNMVENPELYLPEPNKFLATDFDLKHRGEAVNKIPMKILDDDISCIWFKEDVKFKTPKAFIRCLICTPDLSKDVEGLVMTDLFILILSSVLTEEAYPALMAELNYHVAPQSEGFVITIAGFNHKLSLLLETIFDHINRFDPDEELFQNMKNHLLKVCNNRLLNPDKLASEPGFLVLALKWHPWSLHSMSWIPCLKSLVVDNSKSSGSIRELEMSILRDKYWTSAEKLVALTSVNKLALKSFVQRCFQTFFLESLYQGNLTKEEVLSMNTMILKKMNPMPLPEEQRLKLHLTQLPVGTVICRAVSPSIEDQNSVVINYYQFGPSNLKSSCMIALLCDLMVEPCFDVLRTREQLGYDVSCRHDCLWGSYGIQIKVLSPSNKFCCVLIDNRIEEFLNNCLKDLLEMDKEKYEMQRDSFVQCKKCDDLSLDDEHARFWGEIIAHRYIFDRKEQEIQFLENLPFEDFKQWLSQQLEHLTTGKRKLSMQLLGPCDEIVVKLNELSSRQAKANEQENQSQPISQDRNHRLFKSLRFLIDCSKSETARFISDIRIFKESLPFYLPSSIGS